MNYKPHWLKIIFLAIIFNFLVILAVLSTFQIPKINDENKDLIELSWVDVPAVEVEEVSTAESVQTFPEINLPPLEIPKIELPSPPEPIEIEKSVESPKEIETSAESSPPAENKSADDSSNNLVAIVKVYPKDLIEQLVTSGGVKEKIVLEAEQKIILAITIGVDGKVKNAEIIEGGGNDERGKIINFVSQVAAASWIFEPYLDKDGNPIELKTQIEFKPEDF